MWKWEFPTKVGEHGNYEVMGDLRWWRAPTYKKFGSPTATGGGLPPRAPHRFPCIPTTGSSRGDVPPSKIHRDS
jgi:hypothetical protein